MNSIENELFEEFKYVDNICRDMYRAEKGVTTYIEQMEMTPQAVSSRIPQWEYDYKQLKHVRWVRNQISHEICYVECTEADVNWLKDFHNRLLNCQDPLALLNAASTRTQTNNKATYNQPPSDYYPYNYPEKDRNNNLWLWIVLLIVGLAVVGLAALGLLFLLFRFLG